MCDCFSYAAFIRRGILWTDGFFCRCKRAATLPSVKINEYSQLSVGPLRPQKFPSFKWNVTSFFSSLFLGYSLRSCRCFASHVHCHVTPLILIMDFSLDHQWLQLCSLIFSIWRIPWVTLQYLKHSLKPHFVPVDSKKRTISREQVHSWVVHLVAMLFIYCPANEIK